MISRAEQSRAEQSRAEQSSKPTIKTNLNPINRHLSPSSDGYLASAEFEVTQ